MIKLTKITTTGKPFTTLLIETKELKALSSKILSTPDYITFAEKKAVVSFRTLNHHFQTIYNHLDVTALLIDKMGAFDHLHEIGQIWEGDKSHQLIDGIDFEVGDNGIESLIDTRCSNGWVHTYNEDDTETVLDEGGNIIVSTQNDITITLIPDHNLYIESVVDSNKSSFDYFLRNKEGSTLMFGDFMMYNEGVLEVELYGSSLGQLNNNDACEEYTIAREGSKTILTQITI